MGLLQNLAWKWAQDWIWIIHFFQLIPHLKAFNPGPPRSLLVSKQENLRAAIEKHTSDLFFFTSFFFIFFLFFFPPPLPKKVFAKEACGISQPKSCELAREHHGTPWMPLRIPGLKEEIIWVIFNQKKQYYEEQKPTYNTGYFKEKKQLPLPQIVPVLGKDAAAVQRVRHWAQPGHWVRGSRGITTDGRGNGLFELSSGALINGSLSCGNNLMFYSTRAKRNASNWNEFYIQKHKIVMQMQGATFQP